MDIRSLRREEQECIRQAESMRGEADRHHASATQLEATGDMIGASSHTKEALVFEGKAKNFIDKAARLKQQIIKMEDRARYLEHEINELKNRRSAITGE